MEGDRARKMWEERKGKGGGAVPTTRVLIAEASRVLDASVLDIVLHMSRSCRELL